RDAEDRAETRGEDEKPDQGAHECGDEAPALLDEAQALAPGDAGEAVEIGTEPGHAASQRRCRAAVRSWAPPSARISRHMPCRRIRPLCRTMTQSSASTSSTRWVAQRIASRRSATRLRT